MRQTETERLKSQHRVQRRLEIRMPINSPPKQPLYRNTHLHRPHSYQRPKLYPKRRLASEELLKSRGTRSTPKGTFIGHNLQNSMNTRLLPFEHTIIPMLPDFPGSQQKARTFVITLVVFLVPVFIL